MCACVCVCVCVCVSVYVFNRAQRSVCFSGLKGGGTMDICDSGSMHKDTMQAVRKLTVGL